MSIKTTLVAVIACLLISSHALSQADDPDRETIDAAVAQIDEYWSIGDMQSWVGMFAEDASFVNSAMTKPVVGRDAISKLASEWPEVENIREWRVIEGNRMAIGWRERGRKKDGQMGGWYRGMSTFVFDSDGLIKTYEGMFNMRAIRAAYGDN